MAICHTTAPTTSLRPGRGSQMVFEDANVTALLNSTPDAMVFIDPAGAIVFVNAQTEAMFGYRPDELIGQPVEALMPKRFRQPHLGHRDAYTAAPRRRPEQPERPGREQGGRPG